MDKIDKKESKLNNKSDFYYHLPESLIAQRPLEPRDFRRDILSVAEYDSLTGLLSFTRFREEMGSPSCTM